MIATILKRNKNNNELSKTTYAHWTIEGIRDLFETEINEWLELYGEDWSNMTCDSSQPISTHCSIQNLECKRKYIQLWKRELPLLRISSIDSNDILFEMIFNEIPVST